MEEEAFDLNCEVLGGHPRPSFVYRMNGWSALDVNTRCQTSHPDFEDHCYTGMRTNGGARVLSRLLFAMPQLVADRSVLELGCGIGLLACALHEAAPPGAERVHTDGEEEALWFARFNCPDATFELLQWGSPPQHPFDLVLGCDLVYGRVQLDKLMTTIDAALTRGVALLCHRPRIPDSASVLRRVSAPFGLHVLFLRLDSFLQSSFLTRLQLHNIECAILFRSKDDIPACLSALGLHTLSLEEEEEDGDPSIIHLLTE